MFIVIFLLLILSLFLFVNSAPAPSPNRWIINVLLAFCVLCLLAVAFGYAPVNFR